MLPEDKIVSVCRNIQLPVVLLGGPEDREKGRNIALRSGTHVHNSCGEFDLHGSAYLLKNALRVIAHDTGLMHIAAAFKKPVLSIWGNTIPQFGMYPYKPGAGSGIMEVEHLRCRPCSKLGYAKCPKKHFYCMELQNADEIALWANG
jgi:ADP-heptose:LPS heptosyltransferase